MHTVFIPLSLSALVLRGTSLHAGIYWRRESRKGKRELEVPPKPVRRKRIDLDILKKAILALKRMNSAGVTEDRVLNVCLIFRTKCHAALDRYRNNFMRK